MTLALKLKFKNFVTPFLLDQMQVGLRVWEWGRHLFYDCRKVPHLLDVYLMQTQINISVCFSGYNHPRFLKILQDPAKVVCLNNVFQSSKTTIKMVSMPDPGGSEVAAARPPSPKAAPKFNYYFKFSNKFC